MKEFIQKYGTLALPEVGVVEVTFFVGLGRPEYLDSISEKGTTLDEGIKVITYICTLDEVDECVRHCTQEESGKLWTMKWWAFQSSDWIEDKVSEGAVEWGAPDPIAGHPSSWPSLNKMLELITKEVV